MNLNIKNSPDQKEGEFGFGKKTQHTTATQPAKTLVNAHQTIMQHK